MVEIFQIWVAGFLTLCIFSFLYKDNPFYRFAENLYAGLSFGYYIGLMKIYVTKVTKIMESHPLEPDQLMGFRKMPTPADSTVAETVAEPEPTEEVIAPEITTEPTETITPVMEEEPAHTEPTISPVEQPGLETVSMTEVSADVDDVTIITDGGTDASETAVSSLDIQEIGQMESAENLPGGRIFINLSGLIESVLNL